ncbi:ABC transporter permease [Candidatus Babeliales bacterium]|nr:ABC transporter permease [Candidatus Babeliales bacterium]
MKKMQAYAKVFWLLFKKDLFILKRMVFRKIFDVSIWAGSTTFVTAYVFPSLGMPESYGPCFAIGGVAIYGVFLIFVHTANFVADMYGNQVIAYELALPIPSWLVLLQKTCSYAFLNTLLSSVIFLVAKLVLLSRLDLGQISLIKFIPFLILANFFTAFLSLFMSSILSSMEGLSIIWPRILFPLWFFGGSQFTWITLNKCSPKFSYFCLLNPFLYVTEGMRACVLNPADSLSFFICAPVTLGITLIFAFISIRKLKQRLDFV